MKQAFGSRLRAARDRAKISQAALAKTCGWEGGQGRIGNYESGDRWPAMDDIIKLAKAVDTTAQELIFGVDETKPAKTARRGQLALELEPDALTIARTYQGLPTLAKEYVASMLANMAQLQQEHPELAAVMLTRPDPKKRKDHEKKMERLQRLSRKKPQYEKHRSGDDDTIHDSD